MWRYLETITSAALGCWTLATTLTPNTAKAGVVRETTALTTVKNWIGSEVLNRLTASNADQTVIRSPVGLSTALHLLSFGAAGPAAQSLSEKLLTPGVTAGEQASELIALRRSLFRTK